MDPISLALAAISGVSSIFSSSNKTQTQNTSTNESSTSKSSARTLNQPTENALTGVIQNLLSGGQLGKGLGAVAGQLDKVTGQPIQFNAENFVKGVTGAANQKLDLDLTKSLNALFSGIGSSAGGNSMAAILKNNLQRQNAVESAGVEANARKDAVGIEAGLRNNETDSINNLTSTFSRALDSILGGLKGATVTEDKTGTSKSTGTGTGTSTENAMDGNNFGTIMAKLLKPGGISY